MSKVEKGRDQANQEKLNLLANPLSLLTSQKPFWFWKYTLQEKIDRINDHIKPGKKISLKQHEELTLYTGLLELVELLEQREQVYDQRPNLLKVIEQYREIIAKYKQDIEQYVKERDMAIETVDRAIKVCEDWQEMAYQDAPAGPDYLCSANLAMRLQRPHKMN